jgi:hypothetical protein
VISAVNGPALAQQTKLVDAAKQAGTIKQFFPSEFSAYGAIGELDTQTFTVMHAKLMHCTLQLRTAWALAKSPLPTSTYGYAGEDSVPLLFGPKAKTRQAIEAAGIPHTYVVSYGFATYWANGLGEVSQKRDRVPPAPTGDNKVPYFGSGRTKCESSRLPSPAAHWKVVLGVSIRGTVSAGLQPVQLVLAVTQRIPAFTCMLRKTLLLPMPNLGVAKLSLSGIASAECPCMLMSAVAC